MNDSETGGLVLDWFYANREQSFPNLKIKSVGDSQTYDTLQRVCRNLSDQGLIESWRPNKAGSGDDIGVGRISAIGIKKVEQREKADVVLRAARIYHPQQDQLNVEFRQALGSLRARAAEEGSFNSGYVIKSIWSIAETELQKRAALLWTAFVDAHRALGNKEDEATNPEIVRDFLSKMISAEAEYLLEGARNAIPRDAPRGQDSLQRAKDQAEAIAAVTVDQHFDTLRQARQPKVTSTTINNWGSIVGLQTGAHSSISISLNELQRIQTVEALQLVIAALRTPQGKAAPNSANLEDIAQRSIDELRRDKPNAVVLGMWLQTLTNAVQGIASAGPAYDAMRAVLAIVGLG